jgi:hypothetical protein
LIIWMFEQAHKVTKSPIKYQPVISLFCYYIKVLLRADPQRDPFSVAGSLDISFGSFFLEAPF